MSYHDALLVARAFRIANAALVADIEGEGTRVHERVDGRWYDIRPMLDDREHSPEFIDMNREALDYGLAAGVITADASVPHLVRINVR